jgi:HAD superfamily hydrolase (TIGR01509 family)
MIKGVIFDFDGLVFDTETPHYNILNELFKEHGCEFPITRWQQEIGTQSGFSPFKYLEKKINRKVDHDELEKRFKEKFQEILLETEVRPGVEEYLFEAKDLGLKIGLASSSNREWVTNHLQELNLLHHFQCIKTSDDVEYVKPNPELYLETAKCLGLKENECLVFEDSANGALAAKRASMKCVIVPNQVTEAMDFCEVESRINSMSDISLREIIERISL